MVLRTLKRIAVLTHAVPPEMCFFQVRRTIQVQVAHAAEKAKWLQPYPAHRADDTRSFHAAEMNRPRLDNIQCQVALEPDKAQSQLLHVVPADLLSIRVNCRLLVGFPGN